MFGVVPERVLTQTGSRPCVYCGSEYIESHEVVQELLATGTAMLVFLYHLPVFCVP